MTENQLTEKNTLLSWVVCFSAALFFFYEFIQMNMFNAISADLMRDFSIDATHLGNLSAIYFYANLLFLPFAGMLLDRYSTRKIILTTILLCAFGIGAFSYTHSLFWAGVFRFLSGIGSAFCFLSSIRLASRWFPPAKMALVSGLIVTMAMLGGMVAQTPLTLLIEYFGWRHALLLDAGLGLVIAIIIFFNVKNYPFHISQHQQDKIRSQLQSMGIFRSWRLAYLNLQNWMGGIFTSMMNLPIALLGAIWGNLYLVQIEHFTKIQASYCTTLLFIGALFGGPVAGWLSDHLGRRKLPMQAGGVISLVLILAIIYLHGLPLVAYMFLFFLLGFITSAQVISYPLIAESNSHMLTATSVSVVSFCAIAGYAIFQPLFGYLMDLHWHGTIQDNVRIYAASDYYRALWIIPIGFLVGLLANLIMKETYCRAKE